MERTATVEEIIPEVEDKGVVIAAAEASTGEAEVVESRATAEVGADTREHLQEGKP